MEKRYSQLEQGHPMAQTKCLYCTCLYCTCDSGVTRCQSQNQCHFWRMNSMFEAYCTGKWAWQLSIKFMSFMRLWTVAKIKRFITGFLWKCKYITIYNWCILLRLTPGFINPRTVMFTETNPRWTSLSKVDYSWYFLLSQFSSIYF